MHRNEVKASAPDHAIELELADGDLDHLTRR
jgi:hypothetical protein